VGTCFGYDISNIIETINKTLKLERELLITELPNSIWNKIIDTRFKRLELAVGAHKAEKWIPWARGKLQEHRILAGTNTAVMRTDMQALVSQVNNNIYTVDLETKEYSYTVFQENNIPCKHAITTIFARPGRDLVPFIPDILSVATWKLTYNNNFLLVDMSELQLFLLFICYPSLTRVPRGRPKKERFRKEDVRGPRGAAAGNWLSLLAIATTKSGCPTITLPVAVGGIFQVLVEDPINKYRNGI
jgi:hypothetical protein